MTIFSDMVRDIKQSNANLASERKHTYKRNGKLYEKNRKRKRKKIDPYY